MITCDTSVIVAAFARWHEDHLLAARALGRVDALVDHVVVESYSVLTRLPPARRVPPSLVAAFIDRHFPAAIPRLGYPASGEVLNSALPAGISGGSVYDLVVALTAARADATLISLDQRATSTYEAAGVRFELLRPAQR
ncbi:PIN domain-containing protein [Pseudonocardia acaciae]|uniref:PIN domain-containing protein n=1 Tax=Pseudonocardia acaciae TaxID=551276 RepID=UPI00048AA5C5|nr:PIN domain-containing protein [Pseudonocardia acaciae]